MRTCSLLPLKDGMVKKLKRTELNIQPQAGVLGVFSRLNYKPWYAIAEFVDNSTQSFYSHENELTSHGINSITVSIKYDFDKNILVIKDDAFGMEIEDFARAVKVDSPPETKDGRNEFGMGLKTAASWFGNWWSVESTQFGSTNKYYTEINIQELRDKHLNSIDIISVDCEPEDHGTTITISNITKKIDASRTKGKIIQLLESMYRRDLNSGKINIWFNDVLLHFDEYKCLEFRDTIWRKVVDFCFLYDSKVHHVKGFVGILANGGFGRAGFALFRRGRVVIGGEDQNYKPYRIFHQAQSTIAHKLFGEFDLDDFPVNQAKDGFVWDDGLEDAFIDNLKPQIQDYINIAKMTNKERAKEDEFSTEISDKIYDKVQKFTDSLSDFSTNKQHNGTDTNGITNNSSSNNAEKAFKDYLNATNDDEDVPVGNKRKYTIQINEVIKKDFIVTWTIGNKTYWINKEDGEDGKEVFITININHPFFKPYSNNEDFKVVLEKFVISFVVAEEQAKVTSDKDGYIRANTIRHKMNDYLSKVSEE